MFGAIDRAALPGRIRAERVATQHGLGNLGVLGLAWWLRRDRPAAPFVLGLELAGPAGAAVTGRLGGGLVDQLGVSVDPGAHLNASSSRSGRPASAVEWTQRARDIAGDPLPARRQYQDAVAYS